MRERREDIAPLVKMLLQRFAQRYQADGKQIAPAAMQCLEQHDWPGNIRQLEIVLERSFLFADGEIIEHIGFDLVPQSMAGGTDNIDL